MLTLPKRKATEAQDRSQSRLNKPFLAKFRFQSVFFILHVSLNPTHLFLEDKLIPLIL